jgi:hypothetical protein
MLYIGLDIHNKWMTIAGINPDTGETIQMDRVSNDIKGVEQAFEKLEGPIAGVMESGTNAWAMYRILEPYFEKLVVADPATLWNRKTDRGAKTDRRDAMRMALMLYRDEIQALYVPDEKTQDLRILVRAKVRASRWVTKLVNEMGTVLHSWGYVTERRERIREQIPFQSNTADSEDAAARCLALHAGAPTSRWVILWPNTLKKIALRRQKVRDKRF